MPLGPTISTASISNSSLSALIERADADLLNPAEQLAAAVNDARDHRQQQLLRCEQQAGANFRWHAGLCSVLHTAAPFPSSGAVSWQTHSQVGLEPPLLTQIRISTSDRAPPHFACSRRQS